MSAPPSDLRPPTSNDVLVKVSGVSKKFCRSLKRSLWYGVQDIAHDLNPFASPQRSELSSDLRPPPSGLSSDLRSLTSGLRPGEFWAVNDVSFELRRGECLGLIGANGAGKTTLLKMLNGLIKPDAGRIEMRGRVGALIALGAGFNPILTGRENIYVNGSVLGLTRKQIEARIEAIISFADITEFLDSPVQNYSSGMQVRLGFAVAAHLNPDILLVDEVLAVGDMVFQAKCLEHVSRLCRDGCIVIFVSHNEELVRRVCTRGLLLDKGKPLFAGSLNDAFACYDRLAHAGSAGEVSRAGNQKARIQNVEFLDHTGALQTIFRVGQPMKIQVRIEAEHSLESPVLDVGFNSDKGYVAASLHSFYSGHELGKLFREAVIEIDIPQVYLAPGAYRVSALLGAPDLLEIYDWRRNHWGIIIEDSTFQRGALCIPATWRVVSNPDTKL